MNLNCDALQELYNTLMFGPVLSSTYAESPIDMAFKECDEKLSESATFKVIKDIQNRCDNLERSNKALRDDNDKLGDKVIGLNKKNEQLEKELDAKNKENSTLVSANADLSDRNAKLQRNFDRINHLWTGQIQENMELRSKIANLQREKKNYETIAKERADLVKERDEARQDRDAWQRRAKYAEKELDLTKRNRDAWQRRAEESEKRFGELLLKKYDQSFEDLKKDLDDAKSSANYFRASRDNWRSRAKHEEEEKNEQVNKALGEKFQLQREVEQLKKDLDALLSRTHCAEDEVEQLKKDRDIWVRNNGKKQAEIADLKRKLEAREEEFDTWTRKQLETTTQFDELTSQYQKLSIENKRLQYDYNTLHKKYSECEATVDKQAEQIRNLKAKQDSIRKNCYDQGQNDLWDMLQNVNDSQPNEFDVECESMHDVVGMDLDDFLDAYKKWQEEKEQNEIDRMRDWLSDFCRGRVCAGCPLESKEYKCCCGLSFIKVDLSDDRIIPDKDIKRYYEKARGCGRYTLKDAPFYFDNKPVKMENGKLFIHDLSHPTAGVNRAISKACEEFRKAVLDADNKITENLRKGYTLEAKVEVNKDLLEKVCGVKPNEEEHKLDYGDAVRVPWKNYDYMYIGHEGKHIRLFDPKTHTGVVVSVTDNLTYQGCKIILCDEDDIRKIWKDKN